MIKAIFRVDRQMEFKSDSGETIEFRLGDFEAMVIMEPPVLHAGGGGSATVDRSRLQINTLFSSSDGRIWRLVLVIDGEDLLRLFESEAAAEDTNGTVIETVFARRQVRPPSAGGYASDEELNGVLTAIAIGECPEGLRATCRGLRTGAEKKMTFALLRSTVEFDRLIPWGSILTHASQQVYDYGAATVQLQATAVKAGQMPSMTGPSESCVVK